MKRHTCLGITLLIMVVLVVGCGGGTEQLKPVNARDIVHYYGFEGSADDPIGGLNGTLKGSAAFSDFCYVGNNALDLTANVNEVVGSGHSYVQLPEITLPEDMTITFWVYPTGLPKLWVRIFDFANYVKDQNGNDIVGNGIWLNLYDGNGYMTFGNVSATVAHYMSPSAGIKTPVGEWSHVALTMSSEGAKIYVNGKLIASNTSPEWSISPVEFGKLTDNMIGKSRYPDPAFKGYIDDFRIYKTVLSPREIANLAEQ